MKGKSLLLYLVIPVLLMSSMAMYTHAESTSSILWWNATVNGSERYPGGTVYLESWFADAGLNTTSYVLSVDTIGWTTPWDTYIETQTPVTLYPGDGFYSTFKIKIPSNQPIGNTSVTLSVTWRYRATYERQWFAGGSILHKISFIVLPNPYIIQEQLNSLNSSYGKLMVDYKALDSRFNSLQTRYNSLNASYSYLNTTYNSLNMNYTSLKVSDGKLKDDYDKLKSDYNRLKTELESTTAQLKGKTAELNTNTNLMYVSIITTITFVAATIYFARRKPGTT